MQEINLGLGCVSPGVDPKKAEMALGLCLNCSDHVMVRNKMPFVIEIRCKRDTLTMFVVDIREGLDRH
jgi:hypothetical protein